MDDASGAPVRRRRPHWPRTPEGTFLCIGLVFAVLFAALTPPYDVADEEIHFTTVMRIAEGHFLPRGDAPGSLPSFPVSMIELHPDARHGPPFGRPRWTHHWAQMRRLFDIPVRPDQRIGATRLSHYPAPGYAPQVLGALVARVLGLPLVWYLYLGRLGNALAWLALCWLAIRICPVRRSAMMGLALLPMAVFQAGSLSADPLANAAGLFFVAAVLHARLGSTPPGWRPLLPVLAGGLLLGIAKPGYWPLAALALAVPAERCGGAERRWQFLAAVALCTLVPFGLWSLVGDTTRPAAPGADPMAQLSQVLSDPLHFLAVVARTFRAAGGSIAAGFFGMLGKLAIELPAGVCAAYGAALVWAALADPESAEAVPVPLRVGMALLFLAGALFVVILSYVSWNPLGAPVVRGLQGRYFLPLAPLLLVALPSWPRPVPEPWRSRWLPVAWTAGLLYTLFLVVQYYYVG